MDKNPLLDESHGNKMGEAKKAEAAMATDGAGPGKLAPRSSEYEIAQFQPAIFDAPSSQLLSQNPSGKHSEANMTGY